MTPVQFQANLNDKDMYRFNMYHSYTGGQGIFSIIVAVVIFIVTAVTYGNIDRIDSMMYVCLGIIFLLFMPINLKLRSKRQIAMSEVLQGTLHYLLEEEGIVVTTDASEDSATLPWNMVYKVVTTKHNLLIYSNKVNAYIIPRTCIEEQYPAIKVVLEDKLEDYRLRLKWV